MAYSNYMRPCSYIAIEYPLTAPPVLNFSTNHTKIIALTDTLAQDKQIYVHLEMNKNQEKSSDCSLNNILMIIINKKSYIRAIPRKRDGMGLNYLIKIFRFWVYKHMIIFTRHHSLL